MIQRKTVLVDGQAVERVWQVDPRATRAIRGNEWLTDHPQLLTQDIQEMEKSFPHWILVAGSGATPVACLQDGEYIILKDGAMRCVKCDEVHQGQVSTLIWTGMIPVQITGATRVENRIRGLIDSQSMRLNYLDQENALFLFVPVKVVYPTDWNNSAPEGHYVTGFFETLGMHVSSGHKHHMLSESKICMFQQWQKMSIRDVIQNRIAPHALAQVKLANGETPLRWFN